MGSYHTRVLAAFAILIALAGCSPDRKPWAVAISRSFRMGLSAIPPRPDLALLVTTIDLWSQRADMALVLTEPPWDSLLAGRPPDSLVRANQLGLANYYRAKGLRVVASIDPTSGLDRSSDSAPLVAAGRSLTEPAIQRMFRDYAVALDTLVHPDYLALASETNLVRAAAPAALYGAVVQMANAAAADVRAADPSVKLFTTVQVEVAWGRLVSGGTYVGIAQDRTDFPFDEIVGLSSYPYLGGFVQPEDLPNDYYSRLAESDRLPEMVIEGGWTSQSLGGITSSPDKQRRYIARQMKLLDQAGAIGVFQISFTDLDLAAWPQPPGSVLPLFAYLGLVDIHFNPKPALTEWDRAFRRPGP